MSKLLIYNPWITVAVAAWLIAQVLKLILHAVATRRLDFSRLVDTGGMPSSHTALVISLSTAIGLLEGWHTPLFAIALCFSLIIIYDATNLRRSAGFHAEWLNEIVPQLLHGKFIQSETSFRKLRELLGHNPIEVFVGGILGVLVAVWFVKVFMQ